MLAHVFDFLIAGIHVRIISDMEMKVTKSFKDFQIFCDEQSKPQYIASFRAASKIDVSEEKCIYRDGRFLIYSAGADSYKRAFRQDMGAREVYAVSVCEVQKKQINITYLETERESFSDTQKAFLHIGWEWILMKEGKMMLHASCVNTKYGGIVFSGPSGIGKSTQAGLWCDDAEGVLINGDKTILVKQEDGWNGYGSPYAGSSGCYVNAGCRIRAVLFLKQAEACGIRKLEVVESFKKIYTNLTVNHWDVAYVECASTLALTMAMEVPVYEFSCIPDLKAVNYLKEKIFGGEKFDE